MDRDAALQALSGAAERFTPGDLDHTLAQITATAVELVPGVHYASITVRHPDDRLETVAPTDDLLRPLDVAQRELRQGPCYDAATDHPYVVSPDLATDERFPEYSAVAVDHGIRAQAGIRLFATPDPGAQGALNLYSRDVGTFDDMGTVARLFAHQAAVALDYAREVGNLQEGLRTRQDIGRAVGVVMERYRLTEERAFAFLARTSQARNVKLRTIAAHLLDETEKRARE